MERLYDLFQKAPTLGSLINPSTVTEDLFALGFDALRGTLERALKKLGSQADPDRAAVGVAAQGIAMAASLMAREFTLVATNVPYLARGKQTDELRAYIEDVYPAAKADLATAFITRCVQYCNPGGSLSLVSPQNWWFLGSYSRFREGLLRSHSWRFVVSLGEEAWQTFGMRGPRATLLIACNTQSGHDSRMFGIDASPPPTPSEKAESLRGEELHEIAQADQLRNPDSRLSFSAFENTALLGEYAFSPNGMHGGDSPRFRMFFWEMPHISSEWRRLQGTTETVHYYGGRERIFYWADDGAIHKNNSQSRIQGFRGMGPPGGGCQSDETLSCTVYAGELFDISCSPIVPRDPTRLPAIWAFCRSEEFRAASAGSTRS